MRLRFFLQEQQIHVIVSVRVSHYSERQNVIFVVRKYVN